MTGKDRKIQKGRQVTALEKLFRKLGFQTQAEVVRKMKIPRSTLSRMLDRSNPSLMSDETRLIVARSWGHQCKSEEELRKLVKEAEWEMGKEEWREALTHISGGEGILHGVPRLSGVQMVGRVEEMNQLWEWLLDDRGATERTMVMQGTGGVGKTMLAIRAVREPKVWEWYSDAVYWVKMEGQEEADAIRELALKVAGAEALRERDLWQLVTEKLQRKWVLVVLDGVGQPIDLDRWGDILPERGRLLVTSRVAELEGTRIRSRVLKVKGLEEDEALELLTRDVKVDVSEEDLAWVVNELEGLPLALYIGNYISQRDGMLSEFVQEVRTAGLAPLHIWKQKGMSVRVTFWLGYRRLDEWDQALFRGLGVFTPWFESKRVAAILGLDEGAVRRGLRRVGQVGLVENVGFGEYEVHNLVHRYAVELSRGDEQLQEWQERFAAYYLEVAQKANAAQDWEMLGWNLGEIAQGVIYACGLRCRDMVRAYVDCVRAYLSPGQGSGWTDRLLAQVAPLSEEHDEAVRVLEERMELAEGVEDWSAWLVGALERGFLLTRQGNVTQAEEALHAVEEREAEMDDARFHPWVSLLRAYVAWATEQDEVGEKAYQAAVEELAEAFGERMFRQAPCEEIKTATERAIEAWRRALCVENPFRYVGAVCKVYPVLAWLGEKTPDDEAKRRTAYQAAREELTWMEIELPDWEWFFEENVDVSDAGGKMTAASTLIDLE